MESSNITVYTSITGVKDHLITEQNYSNSKFIAFLEDDFSVYGNWQKVKSFTGFIDPRRNSRIQKILAHKYIKTEYSIYIDGNIKLNKPPEYFIEKYLKNHDIAIFKHPTRDCSYEEAITCAKLNLDDPELIIEQMTSYEKDGFPKHFGLTENNVIIRRHTPKIEALNNMWWAELCRFSRRDQLSLMYCIHKLGIRINKIDDFFIVDAKDPNHAVKQSGDVEIISHKHMK